MNSSWPQVPLGEVLVEQKGRVGAFDADGLPLLGVSNTEGLHRTEKPRIADMSRYLRVDLRWFAYNPMRINVGCYPKPLSNSLIKSLHCFYAPLSTRCGKLRVL
jgi:hypothetical protein